MMALKVVLQMLAENMLDRMEGTEGAA